MQVEGNPTVFLILGAVFAAVGIHLFFWSRRQSRLMARFAKERGLAFRSSPPPFLEEQVNRCVQLQDNGVTRTFGRFRDVIILREGTLFRATELLDLNPWGETEFAHHARVALFLAFDTGISGIFSIAPPLEVRQRYPETPAHTEAVKNLLHSADIGTPPCTLSLTLMRGCALVYLEPTVVGKTTEAHLDFLMNMADRLAGLPQRARGS